MIKQIFFTIAALAIALPVSAQTNRVGEIRRETREEVREVRIETRARIEAEREALKTRLKIIKDERKAAIVTKVADAFNAINARTTAKYTETLTKLSGILVRISAEDSTLNLDAAKTAIATAQAAVDVQAGKTYTVTVSTEKNLRPDTEAVVKQLRADLEAVQEKVKAAKEAVRTVLNNI